MSIKYITGIPNRGAGIGHAFVDWAKAFAMAQKYSCKFLYSPFNGNNARWESILGLGFGQKMLSQTHIDIQLSPKDVCLEEFLSISHDQSDYLYLIDGNEHNIGVDWPHSYDSVSRFLRSSYLRSRRIRPLYNPFSSSKIRVAVHIRRGNITKYSEFEDRVLPIDYYATLLNEIVKIVGLDILDIILVSNSESSELSSLINDFGARFYDFNNDIQDLHTLVLSDILIASCSGFSYLASLINSKGIKVVPDRFWHSWPKDAYKNTVIETKDCDLTEKLDQMIELKQNSNILMRRCNTFIPPKSSHVLSAREFRDSRLDNSSMVSRLYTLPATISTDKTAVNRYIVRTKRYLGAFVNTEACTVELTPAQYADFKLLNKPAVFVDLSHLSICTDDELGDIFAFLKRYYNEAFMGRAFVIPHHCCLEARHVLNAKFHNSISCFDSMARILYSPDLIVTYFQPLDSSRQE